MSGHVLKNHFVDEELGRRYTVPADRLVSEPPMRSNDMKNPRAQSATGLTALKLTAAAFVFASATATPILADQARVGPSARERNIDDRERQLRTLEMGSKRTEEREVRLALSQINEDFERIQIINGELKRATPSAAPLDYRFISEATAEIKKRAARLKSNLVLPESERDEKRLKGPAASDDGQLRSSLSVLNGLIRSFVMNPVFKSAGVVDAQLSAKARRDLEDIIELSDKIRKSSEKSSKTSGKPR